MAPTRSAKGKSRSRNTASLRRSPTPLSRPAPEVDPPAKKSKRAETRPCPICEEMIPIRLLAAHRELEAKRVEDIIKSVGSTEFLVGDPGEGLSHRRSAIKARKSLTAMNPRLDLPTSIEMIGKSIQTIVRRRKQRHAKFKDLAKEDEMENDWTAEANQNACPICQQTIRGDREVTEAHVDSCLEHEMNRAQNGINEGRNSLGGEVTIRVTDGVNLAGMGFHVRQENGEDVDHDIDIDGDDDAVFGDAQFTERDILVAIHDPHQPEDLEVNVDEDERSDERTLRELVAKGKVLKRISPPEGMKAVKVKMDEVMGLGDTDKMDFAVAAARRQGNPEALIAALEDKIKLLQSMRVSSSTSLLCRICLDPYTEPTVSTGCWHTCCRECWLRCLGSTKLCPICKRITSAGELRKVYL